MHQGIKLAIVTMLGALLTAGASASQDAAFHHHDDTIILTTPPLVPDGNSRLDCSITNVGATNHGVTIEALDRAGRVVASWQGSLTPGAAAVAIAKPDASARSCTFVVEGRSNDVLAAGLIVVPGLGSISALAAR